MILRLRRSTYSKHISQIVPASFQETLLIPVRLIYSSFSTVNIFLALGSNIVERFEEAISQNSYQENLIHDARTLGDKLLRIERNMKNFKMQKLLFNFQQSLLEIELNSELGGEKGETENKEEESVGEEGETENKEEESGGEEGETGNKEEESESLRLIKRKFTKSVEILEQKHQCPYCSWSCENFKSLQRHVRGTHKLKPQVTSKTYESRNVVICLVAKRNKPSVTCFKRVEKNRICQHLALSHNIQRPPKKQFRGFLTDDEGSSPYDVCWRSANEPDPPEIESIIAENQEASDVDKDNKQDELEPETKNPKQDSELDAHHSAEEVGVVADVGNEVVLANEPDPPEPNKNQEPSDDDTRKDELEKETNNTKQDSEIVGRQDKLEAESKSLEEGDRVVTDVSVEVVSCEDSNDDHIPNVTEDLEFPTEPIQSVPNPAKPMLAEPIKQNFQGIIRDVSLNMSRHTDTSVDDQITEQTQMSELCSYTTDSQNLLDSQNQGSNFSEALISEAVSDMEDGGLFSELGQHVVLDVLDLEPGGSMSNESEVVSSQLGDEESNMNFDGMEEEDSDSEYTFDIDVLEDGSYQVIDHEEVVVHSPIDSVHLESDEQRDSQESVFISAASTGHMYNPDAVNIKTQSVDSSLNTAYQRLPSFPSKRRKSKKMNWTNKKNKRVKMSVVPESYEEVDSEAAESVEEDGEDSKLKDKDSGLDCLGKKEVPKGVLKHGSNRGVIRTIEKKVTFVPDCYEEKGIGEASIEVNTVAEDLQLEDEDNSAGQDSQGEDDNSDGENEFESDADSSDETEESVKRWEKRNSLEAVKKLSCLPENKSVIDKFIQWWQSSGASFVTKNKETSTLRASTNHLFYNKDSFLNFQTSEDESFNLSRLICFDSEEFLALPSPISWLTQTGGKSGQDFPSIRKSMTEGSSRMRQFLVHLLNEHSFKGEAIQQKSAITKHLSEIDDLVKKKKLSSQFEELYQQEYKKKKKMQSIVKPLEEERLHHSVETWFQSKQSEELEIEALTIYQNSMKGRSISNTDYDRFARIVFFEAVLFDKSRVGMLESLKNEEYFMKLPTWIPSEVDELELDKLPQEWLLYSPPYEGAPVSSYQIEVNAGEKSKNHQDHSIVMSPRVYELVEKMINLKELKIPEVKLEDYLFVNHSNKKLPKLQNYPGTGSLLYQFGLVVGIEKFTFKMLRKKAEGVIQGSASLAKTVKDLNCHSQKVGEQVYDQRRGARRTVFVTSYGKKEGGCSSLRKDKELDESEKKKREDRTQSVKKDLVRKAKQFLEDLAKKERPDFRPTAVKESEVETLKTLFNREALGKHLTD